MPAKDYGAALWAGFELLAIRLRPYRVALAVVMASCVASSFFGLEALNRDIAAATRSVLLTLAWWAWCLILVTFWFLPRDSEAPGETEFSGLASVLRYWAMMFVVIAIAFPVVASLVSVLFR